MRQRPLSGGLQRTKVTLVFSERELLLLSNFLYNESVTNLQNDHRPKTERPDRLIQPLLR